MAGAVSGAFHALNRLTKWRSFFAGWQLGTRAEGDAECQAVRDHREVSLCLRAEVSALVGLLVAKGVFTAEEWDRALESEANQLAEDLAKRFPGIRCTDVGLTLDTQKALETMRKLGFKP